jgi:hypothetical protein
MFMRRRPLLRTAVVGGGAYMAGRAAANRSADQQSQDQRISDLEQQQAQAQVPAQQPAPPQAAASNPLLDQLNQLAALHQSGALTDDEFASAKAKLLA